MSEQDYFAKDYYKVLGVDKKATDAEIKKSFRKLSRKYHPDQNPGNKQAEEKFKEITEANTVLSSKKERQKYDEIRAMASGGPRFASGSGGAGGFQDMFGGGFHGGGQSYSSGGFDDILSNLFGGQGAQQQNPFGGGGSPFGNRFGGGDPYAQQRPAAPKKPSVDKTYKLSVKNAIFGAKLKHKLMDGSEVTFKVPAGVQSGKILLVKGPSGKSERIKIEVAIPDASKLSQEQQTNLKTALTAAFSS